MNNSMYEKPVNACNEVTAPCDESVASVIRGNSNKIASTFSTICTVLSAVSGKPSERDGNDKEPLSLFDEVLWQRSMLNRIGEELTDLCVKLGV